MHTKRIPGLKTLCTLHFCNTYLEQNFSSQPLHVILYGITVWIKTSHPQQTPACSWKHLFHIANSQASSAVQLHFVQIVAWKYSSRPAASPCIAGHPQTKHLAPQMNLCWQGTLGESSIHSQSALLLPGAVWQG